MLKWCGKSFDPEETGERDIRMIIGSFAARRRCPLMSHRHVGSMKDQ
ncbi:hypothetical protein ROG8370_01604 [Roseovarius gaetbuli]|uniref:Uncharacterized protein n=1 Tax=Roseovarius gaetbuli TaxID=1356575 RepID=A0A1X6Z3I1_9RHOB|nr:hypothetical protein ROG8370_01604 [Roseovarius gaetbuli]